MDLNAIRSRIKSIPPVKRLKIAAISTAADKVLEETLLLIDEMRRLEAEVNVLKELAYEDD